MQELILDYNTRLEEGNFPGGGEGSLPPFDFDYTVLTSEDDMAIEITTEDSMFTALRVLKEIKILRAELIGDEDSPDGFFRWIIFCQENSRYSSGNYNFYAGH